MSLYPENPAGQVQLVSQDTYASANLPLSVVGSGGGGGGPVPANLQVSTLKVNGTGNITLNPNISYIGESASINFLSDSQESTDQGYLAVSKGYMSAYGFSTFTGLVVKSISTGAGLYQPIAVGGIVLGQNFSGGAGDPNSASIIYNSQLSTVNINAPSVNISSLVGVSSINGAAYTGSAGTVPPNLALSTLTVNGVGNITLSTNPDSIERSTRILLKSGGQDTLDAGILQVLKGIINDYNGSTIAGLQVSAYSTLFGAAQPIIVGSVLVAGEDNDAANEAASITYTQPTSTLTLTAQAVGISSLVGVSSINGINWNAISTLVG